jgi:hypothetical protein
VKRQQLVAVSIHLLEDSCTQNQLGTHPIGAGILQRPTLAKVLMNQVHYGKFEIQNPTDAFQVPGLGMIDRRILDSTAFFSKIKSRHQSQPL